MAGEVTGMKELSLKLAKLGQQLGTKTLRSAAVAATTPVMKEMKAAIPVGKVAHRTHKGRLVAPGYAKRSVRRRSSAKKGKVNVVVGVLSEAFYAVHFVDPGTKKMTAQKWFKKVFILATPSIVKDLTNQLRTKIAKAIR